LRKPRQPADTGRTVYSHNCNDSIEKLLRKFKKRVQGTGVLEEYKDRQYFKKPSTIKREKVKKYKHNAKNF